MVEGECGGEGVAGSICIVFKMCEQGTYALIDWGGPVGCEQLSRVSDPGPEMPTCWRRQSLLGPAAVVV